MTAFTDSVDATSSYTAGICGEKRMILDALAPTFLSIISSSATSPFKVKFDHSLETASEIGSHTINYTVKSIEYSMVPDITGTFTFQIKKTCTSLTASTLLNPLEYTVT